MTREEQRLLCADLSARLPYGVKYVANIRGREGCVETMVAISYRKSKKRGYEGIFVDAESGGWDSIDDVKPYLRPMSSMKPKENADWFENSKVDFDCEFHTEATISMEDGYLSVDWLNKHHFDYRGLIKMGLALEAPEGMYETETEQLW